MQIEIKLQLMNNTEDSSTYFSRRWMTTTPALSFTTDNLLSKTKRTILAQLGGSDHRLVKLQVDIGYKMEDFKPLPRWNYKKANWALYAPASPMST